jgi:hypothetical protein
MPSVPHAGSVCWPCLLGRLQNLHYGRPSLSLTTSESLRALFVLHPSHLWPPPLGFNVPPPILAGSRPTSVDPPPSDDDGCDARRVPIEAEKRS